MRNNIPTGFPATSTSLRGKLCQGCNLSLCTETYVRKSPLIVSCLNGSRFDFLFQVKNVKKILVSFGGTDPTQITTKIFKVIENLSLKNILHLY